MGAFIGHPQKSCFWEAGSEPNILTRRGLAVFWMVSAFASAGKLRALLLPHVGRRAK
jgi:hypothetical protein